jgi:hypothetical protein
MCLQLTHESKARTKKGKIGTAEKKVVRVGKMNGSKGRGAGY